MSRTSGRSCPSSTSSSTGRRCPITSNESAVAVLEDSVVTVPALPYRGIQPYRYVDHPIFFAREEETRDLLSLVLVYRGVMLYGDSGAGKSSLINAGLIAAARNKGFQLERVRVQPLAEQEFVVERIALADEREVFLPSLFVPDEDTGPRLVLSTAAFEERLRAGCVSCRPLLVFDQFEELVTLFEEAGQRDLQRRTVGLLVALLRDEVLPVKLLFAFREDYLARVKQLLDAVPELVDQALRLSPPGAEELTTIIRGPFERYPDHFERKLTPELAQHLRAKLADRFGSGEVSLSEVQTVCLRLWQSDEPEALLDARGVQGLLEDYLGEELDGFPPDLRYAAVALLSQMVTSAGTRSVVSAEDLIARVREDEKIPAESLARALDRLESESKLVRRERRRDLYLYEITSEFLVPWISRRRDELVSHKESRRLRRRLLLLGSFAGFVALVVVLSSLGLWALAQQRDARRAEKQATSLVLAFSSAAQLDSRPDVSLLLGLAAYRTIARAETRSSMISALEAARSSGAEAILHGHTDSVTSVAFSPDGRTLASGGDDRTVRLWNVRTQKPLGEPLSGHTNRVLSVAFSPNGSTLASGSGDGTARLWDVGKHKQLGQPLRGHAGGVWTVAFSLDGRTLASAGRDRAVRLWDVRTRKPLGQPLRGHNRGIYSVAFSPNGRTLASGSGDGTVRLWDVRTRKPLGQPLRGHSSSVYSVAFSLDGATLASGSGDGTIRLWNVRARNPLRRTLLQRGLVLSVAFNPDGDRLAAANADKTVRLWDVRSGRSLLILRGHTESVLSVAFSPNGRTLASGSDDRTVRLWGAVTHTTLGQPLRGHSSSVYSVAFSLDGRTLASAGRDRAVRLWDVRTRKPLGQPLRGHSSSVYSVAFSPDGRTLASGSGDGTVRLWDVRTRKPLGQPLRGHSSSVYSVAFSPDGATLASASADDTVRLWDVRTRKPLGKPLRGHRGSVYSVAFSSDGATLASASEDDTVRLWDLRTRKPLGKPLRGHRGLVYSAAFSPDGATLASGSADDTVRLWDVRTRKPLGQPLRGHREAVGSVGFSPDGAMLLSASADDTVRLWDVRTRKPLGQPLRGHREPVRAAAFSPDGATLASAGYDGTVRLWEGILWRNTDHLITMVCGLVGGKLTEEEWAQLVSEIRYRSTCS